MSSDNFIVTLEKGVAAGIYGREARSAAKQPTVQGAAPSTNHLVGNVSGAEVEQPWLESSFEAV